MSDDTVRAQVLHAVRAFCGTDGFLSMVEQARADAKIESDHRLSQIATSLAWHAKRRLPAERLEAGARELARLWERAGRGDDGEAGLYLLLVRMLGLDAELRLLRQRLAERRDGLEHTLRGERDPRRQRQIEREQRPQIHALNVDIERYDAMLKAVAAPRPNAVPPWVESVAGRLRLPSELAATWRPQLRLRMALAAVQTVQTLQATAPLQAQVAARHPAHTEEVFPWRR
jgi:hypothetical protein